MVSSLQAISHFLNTTVFILIFNKLDKNSKVRCYYNIWSLTERHIQNSLKIHRSNWIFRLKYNQQETRDIPREIKI